MRTFSDLQQLESREQEVNLIERYIKSKAVPGAPLQILEAGCGQKWPINLDQPIIGLLELIATRRLWRLEKMYREIFPKQ